MDTDFQPIPLEDVCKQTKNARPYTQNKIKLFYFIEKKTKNLLRDWHA